MIVCLELFGHALPSILQAEKTFLPLLSNALTLIGGEGTFGGAHSVGIDTAYLIGDISNMIDEDAPVEDCTTMYQPRRQKKNTGPVMGGM